jgi:hypothetical protein
MNLPTKLCILTLLIFSSTQCMEIIEPKNNTETLFLNSYVIRKFIKVNTENKFNLPDFRRRLEKIILLQRLADQGVQITFNSKNEKIPSWLDKNIDITQKTLYNFLFFLSYHKNKPLDQAHYSFCEQDAIYERNKTITHTLCLNNSQLNIITEKNVKSDVSHMLSKFLKQYEHPMNIMDTSQHIKNQSCVPDENNINNWHRYIQLLKNEIEPINQNGCPYKKQRILKLSNSKIQKIINTDKYHKESKSIDFDKRLRRLKILQQLALQGAIITFTNEDLISLSDQDAFKITAYNKLFPFLNYDNNSCQAATGIIGHSSRYATISICLNNSLLHITTATRAEYSKQKFIEFISEYQSPTTNTPPQKNDQSLEQTENSNFIQFIRNVNKFKELIKNSQKKDIPSDSLTIDHI